MVEIYSYHSHISYTFSHDIPYYIMRMPILYENDENDHHPLDQK